MKEEFKGVGVFVEQRRGVIQEASLQLLGEGRRLAAKLNTEVIAMMIGYNIESIVKESIYYGADTLIYADDERCQHYNPEVYTQILAEWAKKYKPEILLMAGTKYGRELAPSVAARLETGVTADCTGFDIDDAGNLGQIRPPFGGRVLAYIIAPEHRPEMATARPNTFPTPPRDVSRRGKMIREEVDLELSKLKLIKFEERRDTGLPVEKAEIVVSWGRGLRKTDVEMVKELCSILTTLKHPATVGCSRPIVDAGLMPKSRQVGQTGKSVRPKLYMAVGISGAAQHIAGMKDSEYVVAINKDPNADIFKFCDLGLTADYNEVLPILIEELKKLVS